MQSLETQCAVQAWPGIHAERGQDPVASLRTLFAYSVNFHQRIDGILSGTCPKLARPVYLEVCGACYLVFDESARCDSDARDALPMLYGYW